MILIAGQNLAWQRVCLVPQFQRGKPNFIAILHAFGSSKGPNVARALAALGGESEALVYSGGFSGRLAEEDLAREGVPCKFVSIRAETRTCTTIIEPDGTCTEVIEPSPVVTVTERRSMRRLSAERLQRADLLIVSGTAMEGEADDCYSWLVRSAHERNIPVVLDSSCPQARRALQESPEVLKINTRELAEMVGGSVDTLADRIDAYGHIAHEFGVRWFFVTRGAAGIEAYDGRTALQASPPPVQVANPIGSGDAATAGVAWVIHGALAVETRDAVFASQKVLRDALLTATAMGTANCLNWKNGMVVRDDYQALKPQIRIDETLIP